MSLPRSILAFVALGLSIAPAASTAPGTLRSLDPVRVEATAAIDSQELSQIAARIEAVTELRNALATTGVAESDELAGPLHEALGDLYDPAGFATLEVSLEKVRSLVEATRSLTEAETAAVEARSELRRAIAAL